MRHFDEGQLRAALDGQLDDEAARHLGGCPKCQARLETLRADLQPVQQRLAWLASQPSGRGPDPRAALARFKQREIASLRDPGASAHTLPVSLREGRCASQSTAGERGLAMTLIEKERSMFQKLFASRAFQVGIAAVLVLALIVAIPATRAWAGQFLGLFRVQQVEVLPVDAAGFEQLSGNDALVQQISQLIASSVDVTQKPGDPVNVGSAAEAGQQAGFTVRLPADAPAQPELSVTGSGAFTLKIDRAKAQAVLDEAGRTDLVLPETLDGADVQVNIPASLRAAYGACPPANGEGVEVEGRSRRYADCILLAEMPSPTVNTPPDIDFQQLAALGLQFTGMSQQEAEEFSQTVDWTTSLVIPIPRNAATYQTVSVDGVEGKLIERPADDAPQFVLVWVKDGIIHAISGWGDRAETALRMANSLQ